MRRCAALLLLAAAAAAPPDAAPDAAAAAVAAATILRATEDELAQTDARVAALAEQRRALAPRRDAEAAALTPLLPLMQRLSLFPVESVLAVAGSPRAAARGLLVVRTLAEQVRVRAEVLRAQDRQLADTAAALDAARARLRDALASQREQAAALDALAARAEQESRAADARAAEAARQASEAAARKASLREAVASLPHPKPAAPITPAAPAAPAAPVAARQGGWVSPVAGTWSGGFGAQASGATILAPPGARVVAPCGGSVAFAQPFRSYGKLAIIDCGGATHVVLGGLDRLDVSPGQALRAGQPVGVMAAAGRAALYVEVRRAGEPVDPAPLLRAP